MPCEDAPCCGCCTIASYRDQADAEERYWEERMLGLDDCNEDNWDEEPDDSMDGDFDSGMASAGYGTDEDYGFASDVY